jgi:hypothetical protein
MCGGVQCRVRCAVPWGSSAVFGGVLPTFTGFFVRFLSAVFFFSFLCVSPSLLCLLLVTVEPPKGLPTVFDPSYKGVGQKVGLEIWRVEALKVVKKAANDECYQGKFWNGDSYIILQTKVRVWEWNGEGRETGDQSGEEEEKRE